MPRRFSRLHTDPQTAWARNLAEQLHAEWQQYREQFLRRRETEQIGRRIQEFRNKYTN